MRALDRIDVRERGGGRFCQHAPILLPLLAAIEGRQPPMRAGVNRNDGQSAKSAVYPSHPIFFFSLLPISNINSILFCSSPKSFVPSLGRVDSEQTQSHINNREDQKPTVLNVATC